jgi:hypothetical protein
MVTTQNYDWSTLDRNFIKEMITVSSSSIVGNAFTPHAFTKEIRDTFRSFDVPIKVTMTKNKETTKNAVWVGGLYDSNLDEKHQ